MEKNTVLLIDDNEDDYLAIKRLLKTNYKTIYNDGSGDIIKLIEKYSPICIILDYHIGSASGIDLLIIAKNNKLSIDIPIIMMTGEKNPKIIVNCMTNGASDYLCKGDFGKEEILYKIENVIETSALNKKIKLQQLELELNEAKLRTLNGTKDKFFSIISHDLRSPFNTIFGYAELLSDNFEQIDIPTQKQYITNIYRVAKQSFNLLNELLLWARCQNGTVDFNPSKESVYYLAFDIIILNEISKDIIINADRNMFSTIIRNLLSNAIKFTHKNGEIIINTHKIIDSNDIEMCQISIIDNGVGIPIEKQPHLFSIDSNTSTVGTDNEAGTGLGLLLCKEFIDKHNGSIWVESEVGKGSKFVFTIPLS